MKHLLTLALLAPTAALAHPGDHSGLSVQSLLGHILLAPDHVAIVGAVVAGLVLLYRARARK